MATKFPKFSQALAQDPATRRIWYGIATAHDLESHDGMTEESLYQKIFASHFGHLAIIFLWTSGNLFHVAWQGNFQQWVLNPLKVKPIAHAIWDPHFGQSAIKAFTRGGVSYPVNIATSGVYHWWYTIGMRTNSDLYFGALGLLVLSTTLLFAGWLHLQPKFRPGLAWFKNNESRLNHHLSGLFGVSSLAWSGHLIHVAIPESRGQHIRWDNFTSTLPHPEGLTPFFTGNWSVYAENPDTAKHIFGTSEGAGTAILTFLGGFHPQTQSMWLTDIAHHHLAIAIVFIFAGHMYRTNWGIGHSMKEILEAHKGPLTGEGHKGLYEVLTTSWHAQLAINLAMVGSLSIIVAHHMYAMPPYPYIGIDYATQLCIFTHHMWIGGFCVCGAGAHASIFMVRDYSPVQSYNNLLDRVLRHRDAIISHLNWVCIFLGTHSFGLYIHNDTMRALGRPQDMFSDKAIQLQPIFAKWIQSVNFLAPGNTAPNALATSSYAFGGDVVAVNGKIAMMPIQLGTADFMVHHVHAFTIHVTVLILLKGTLFARSSRLIPDKANLGFRFPCDGPGRGGTCQVSAWDHVFLGLFWMYNCISVTIFHFSWKMQSDVWGTISSAGKITHITGGNFGLSALTVNGWLRDFLWSQASQVIQSYGSALSAYGLIFLGAHFIWAFSLMFLFSGRGYWQELIESIVWAHNKLKLAPAIQPRALSITQGRAVGLAHYLLGGIGTTWSFFHARIISVG
mmetsp:Transcript_67088/g.184003  ORF Transcript_67088/g.184003 Transcript_67088/m.184003 type:complete len:732 (+) Transcript_67088:1375-3570(+)